MNALLFVLVYLLLCHLSTRSAGLKTGTPDYWLTFVIALIFTPILVFIYALILAISRKTDKESDSSAKKKKDDGGIGFISDMTGVDFD